MFCMIKLYTKGDIQAVQLVFQCINIYNVMYMRIICLLTFTATLSHQQNIVTITFFTKI